MIRFNSAACLQAIAAEMNVGPNTRDELVSFFGESTNVRDITVEQAREWRKPLVTQPGSNGATF